MSFKVALVGATGAVGKEMLELLKSRHFPISKPASWSKSTARSFAVKLMEWLAVRWRCLMLMVLANGC